MEPFTVRSLDLYLIKMKYSSLKRLIQALILLGLMMEAPLAREWTRNFDCFTISPGRRLSKTAAGKAFTNNSVLRREDCLFKCLSINHLTPCTAFSFGIENNISSTCELSTLDPHSSSNYNARESTTFDLFELKEDCSLIKPPSQSSNALPLDRQTRHNPSHSQCYYLKFGSRRFPDQFGASKHIAASLVDCQRLCSSEKTFTCRGLSFTYARDAKDFPHSHNCVLTDQDLSQANKFDPSLGLTGEAFTDIYLRTTTVDWCQESEDTIINPYQSLNTLNSKCFKGFRKSYKHYAYRDYASVKSIEECYTRCRDSGYCKTFSFRFSRGYFLRDCLLSHLSENEINSRDLVSTHGDVNLQGDWEVFSLQTDKPSCANNYGPVNTHGHQAAFSTNCFNLIGPKSKHYGSTIYGSVNAKDVTSCSIACHQDSRCQSFSFPTATFRANLENCALSGLSFSGKTEKDLESDFNWNTFEILDAGNLICSTRETAQNNGGAYREEAYYRGKKGCFRRINYGFSFNSKLGLSVGNLKGCFEACKSHAKCQALSYMSKTNYGEVNCLLKEESIDELTKEDQIFGKSFAELYAFSLNCQEGMSRDCEMILNLGFGLHDSVLKTSLEVGSFEDCSDLCRRDGSCIYFGYKYNLVEPHERNCEISAYDSLGSQDFVPNSNWNVYVQLPKCRNGTKNTTISSSSSFNSSIALHECFDLTKAGYRHGVSKSNNGIYLKSLSVNGIGQCRSECEGSSSGRYICLSFSYRYDRSDILSGISNVPNCILSTASAPKRITSWKQEDNIVPDSAWDVYNRNIDEPKCLPPQSQTDEPVNSNCIDVIKTNVKHHERSVFLALRRLDLKSCLMACLSSSSCLSFSYRPLTILRYSHFENCLLSDVRKPNFFAPDVQHKNGWQILAPRFDGVFRKCFPVQNEKNNTICYQKVSHIGPLRRVSKSLSATDFEECLKLCAQREDCLTFDYKISSSESCSLSSFDPLENELEGRLSRFRRGRHAEDFVPRDVYVFQTCSTPKCSRVFKRSHRLNSQRILVYYDVQSLTTDTLEKCEALCLNSKTECEYFAFRSGLIGNNCEILVMQDSTDNHVMRGILTYDEEWNVYKVKGFDPNRGDGDGVNDGSQECTDYDNYENTGSFPQHSVQNHQSNTKYPLYCFDPFFKVNMDLKTRVVTKVMFVRNKEECALECLRMGNHCSAFSYRIEKNLPYKDCKLSDLFNRNPETDLQQDNYYEIWELSSRCSLSFYNYDSNGEGGHYDTDSEVNAPRPFHSQNDLINYPFFSTNNVSSQGILQQSQHERPGNWYPSNNYYLTGGGQSSSHNGHYDESAFNFGSHDGDFNHQNNGFVSLSQSSVAQQNSLQHSGNVPSNGQSNSFLNYGSQSHHNYKGGAHFTSLQNGEHRFDNNYQFSSSGGLSQIHQGGEGIRGGVWSVSGRVCQDQPKEDPVIGFRFCSTDLGGIDYVCRPDSKCSIQNGYSYPWCYVGKSTTQWRPCEMPRQYVH